MKKISMIILNFSFHRKKDTYEKAISETTVLLPKAFSTCM